MAGERPIDHWNYRVFCQQRPDGIGGTVAEFTIREAYYDASDTRPHSWTEEPSTPYGETKLALMEDVTAMAAAISSPVLYLTDDGIEIASEEAGRKLSRASLRH